MWNRKGAATRKAKSIPEYSEIVGGPSRWGNKKTRVRISEMKAKMEDQSINGLALDTRLELIERLIFPPTDFHTTHVITHIDNLSLRLSFEEGWVRPHFVHASHSYAKQVSYGKFSAWAEFH